MTYFWPVLIMVSPAIISWVSVHERLTIAVFPFRDILAGIIASLLMLGRSDPGEFGPGSVLAEFFKALLTTSMS